MSEVEWPAVLLEGSEREGSGREDSGVPVEGAVLLRRVLDNDVSMVVLRNFLPRTMIDDAMARICEHAATPTLYSNAQLTTIGPYLVSRLGRLDSYFEEAGTTDRLFDDRASDPRAFARDLVRRTFGFETLTPLRDPVRGPYAAGIVRLHANGIGNPLHNDSIARDGRGSGLEAARMEVQLTCVVCLQECTSGGELKLFRQRWQPEDEVHKIRGGLGYEDDVVSGSPFVEFRPKVGDIYVFDPKNYHEIAMVEGSTRVTLGFFIGLSEPESRSALCWA